MATKATSPTVCERSGVANVRSGHRKNATLPSAERPIAVNPGPIPPYQTLPRTAP